MTPSPATLVATEPTLFDAPPAVRTRWRILAPRSRASIITVLATCQAEADAKAATYERVYGRGCVAVTEQQYQSEGANA